MRGAIGKMSDAVLSLVAPRATARARQCVGCTYYQRCSMVLAYGPGNYGPGYYTVCNSGINGMYQIGCQDHCP